jgi:hypothetical protein
MHDGVSHLTTSGVVFIHIDSVAIVYSELYGTHDIEVMCFYYFVVDGPHSVFEFV